MANGRPPRRVQRVRHEGGYALPELLIGAALGLAMIGSAVALFTTALGAEPRTSARTADIADARLFAESVARELRQGRSAPTATATDLALITYVKRSPCAGTAPGPAIPCLVTYSCEAGSCTRAVSETDGTGAGPAVLMVEGLASDQVFSYAPDVVDPSFIGINLSLAAGPGEDSITISDGVTLRNPPWPVES